MSGQNHDDNPPPTPALPREASVQRGRRQWGLDDAQPRRVRRQRLIMSVAGIASLVVGWLAYSQRHWTKPGPLTDAHAQILSDTKLSDACGACHDGQPFPSLHDERFDFTANQSAAPNQTSSATDNLPLTKVSNASPTSDLQSIHGLSNDSSMTARCMQCHQAQFSVLLAKRPHHFPLNRDLGDRWENAQVECAACHREHKGAGFVLTKLTNDQCQSCHQARFDSFEGNHPEFQDYPPSEPSPSIAFNHVSHRNLHFPKSDQASFDCRKCHQTTVRKGAREEVVIHRHANYQTACAGCHDRPIRVANATGLKVFQDPNTNDENLVDEIADWISIRADQTQLEWTKSMVEKGVPLETAQRLVAGLSPQLLRDTIDKWESPAPDSASLQNGSASLQNGSGSIPSFQAQPPTQPKTQSASDGNNLLLSGADDGDLLGGDLLGSDDSLGGGDLLGGDSVGGGDLLGGDPMGAGSADPLADPLMASAETKPDDDRPTRFRPDDEFIESGWYRDDLTKTIIYAGGGHDDPVWRALMEGYVSQGRDLSRFNAHAATKTCLECHPGLNAKEGFRWKTKTHINRYATFDHTPHLTIPKLSNCVSCHQMVAPETAGNNEASTASKLARSKFTSDFTQLRKSECSTCHRSGAAPNDCTHCHDYHRLGIDSDQFVREQIHSFPVGASAMRPLQDGLKNR